VQDSDIERGIAAYDQANNTTYTQDYVTQEKQSIVFKYRALDAQALAAAPEDVQQNIQTVVEPVKKGTLAKVAVLPGIMLLCYIALGIYFKAKGGYQVRHAHE